MYDLAILLAFSSTLKAGSGLRGLICSLCKHVYVVMPMHRQGFRLSRSSVASRAHGNCCLIFPQIYLCNNLGGIKSKSVIASDGLCVLSAAFSKHCSLKSVFYV